MTIQEGDRGMGEGGGRTVTDARADFEALTKGQHEHAARLWTRIWWKRGMKPADAEDRR